MKLGLFLGTCRPPLCRVGCNLLIRFNLWKYLLGSLLKSVGSGCSREVLKTLKSEVSRSFSVVSPLRCDPKCGQRRQHDAAVSPRCDPMRGQRGKQKPNVDFNDAGKDIVRNSVAGRDASSCPSGMASTMVSSARASREAAGCGTGMCRTSSGKASSKSLSSACSSPGASGRGAALRPLVLRRGSPSSVATMTQSGACSSPGASRRDAELGRSVSALQGKARKCGDVSFSELFDRCMSPSQRVAHVSDCVTSLLSTPTRDMHINSCGSMHGSVMHDNSSGMHVNSCGALGHKNSCHVHAAEVRRGTKALSTSTRLGVRCLAVDEFAHTQQAPRKSAGTRKFAWRGMGLAYFTTRARRFSGRWKSFEGVQQLWPVLHVLIILLSHLGQAE